MFVFVFVEYAKGVAYSNGQMVFCKGCGARQGSNATIYHCSVDGNSSSHPSGYDLCNGCYQKQLDAAFIEMERGVTMSGDDYGDGYGSFNDPQYDPLAAKTRKEIDWEAEEDEKEMESGSGSRLLISRTSIFGADIDEEIKNDIPMVTLADVKKYENKISELRNVFPRFYFLSDDDMIRLIKDPTPINVNQYISCLFQGISSLVLDEDNDKIILGLRASNGEILIFGRLINVGKKAFNGSLDWLLKIEYQMRYSMSIQLEESFTDYKNLENSERYFDWINNYPTQIILITKRCLWCKTVEFFLNKKVSGSGLDECLKEIKAEISLLSGYVYKLIKDAEKEIEILKSKIGALIQQLVYQRDVTQLLIKQKISSADDRIWISKMRTYYMTDDNMLDQYNIFKKLFIRCNGKVYYYGYEFYGDITHFIFSRTMNTDTLFPQLLQTTIDRNNVSNVYGDINTGTTEALKVFAYDLGRPCKVFNEMNINSDITHMNDSDRLFNWFAGISSCGGFGILSEKEVQQFGGQISYYATSINYHLNENKNHMIINDKRIALHANTRIFLVTNKKYLNNDSNDIMSKIVEPTPMPLSNNVSIATTLLSTNGYQTAEDLATKIAMLLELCISLLITENTYDFGFKLIMKIAEKAGEALIFYVQNGGDEIIDNDENDQVLIDDFEDDDALNTALKNGGNIVSMKTNKNEENLVIESLIYVMFEMLSDSDCILFESLIESSFPENNIDWSIFNKASQTMEDKRQRRLSKAISSTFKRVNDIEDDHFNKPSKPKESKTNISNYKYNEELEHFMMAGFTDTNKIKELLDKNYGDTEATMLEILNCMV